MSRIVVLTTSYPNRRDDAEGHFVGAEVRRWCESADVTVLAPGHERATLFGERVVSLGGGEAFGFPGAVERLRRDPRRLVGATQFTARALGWLRRERPERVIAHFLLPCGVPVATRGVGRETELEIVVHGSDARLFARLPLKGALGRELVRSGASLRFVSSQLRELLLGCLPARERALLEPRCRVEPAAIDVQAVPSRASARTQLGLDSTSKVAVIVARLVPGKRVDVALEACARVSTLQSIVIGAGPEQSALQRRFPRTRFVGHVERPVALAYISAADVLVSASLSEGAPTVVREARALGTPVVCLEAGDVAKWAESDPGIDVIAV
jgi:glycosyltransferase involved in cell wall biosynthesis